jgi:hypothetical protein
MQESDVRMPHDRPSGISPGTVSRILWHFTGGPRWNPQKKKQESSPKEPSFAYENLKSILRQKELHLGEYKEVVRVIVPERRVHNRETHTTETQHDVPVEITSAPVCCLADIPAPHLHYHAYRYGKFAIGFHRASVIEHGFNPVFYTLEDTPVIRSIHEGFSCLEVGEPSDITDAINSIELAIDDANSEFEDLNLDIGNEKSDVESAVESMERAIDNAKDSIETFLAFIKTFAPDEFGTIYCEREWRTTEAFKFDIDDVGMIVLPKKIDNVEFFRDFVEKVAPRLRIPRRIPIMPWEDLVES